MFWLINISYGYIADLNVYKRESPITVISLMPMNVQAAENAKEYSSKEKISFEIRDSKDLAILSRELDRFIAQKPNSTEKEQEKHLISFM